MVVDGDEDDTTDVAQSLCFLEERGRKGARRGWASCLLCLCFSVVFFVA